MTKIIFLLPPSEGKNIGGNFFEEQLSYSFKKPKKIAISATEKDLKCTGKRYEEGIEMNKYIFKKASLTTVTTVSSQEETNYMKSVERYSGVMYSAISYGEMFESGKRFFDENVLILSGMYGLLKPNDIIGNYKLPIETKGLVYFWGKQITKELQKLEPEYIVNLLPLSYQKMIDFKKLNAQIIDVNFYIQQSGTLKKMTHGVKKVKGEWLREICERQEKNYNNLGGIVHINEGNVEVQIII